MKLFSRLLFLSFANFVFVASANPIAISFITEVQVSTPTQWKIELDRRSLNYLRVCDTVDSCKTDSLSIRTSRYSDTFHVRLTLTKTDSFVVITPNSIRPIANHLPIVEMQKRDTIFLYSGKREIDRTVVTYVGADSSICACAFRNYVLSDTPTIGSTNRISSNHLTLHILSSKDSLPVSGLGLYKWRDMEMCPSLFSSSLTGRPIDLYPNACQPVNYEIMDHACGTIFGHVNYGFDQSIRSKTDTIFITPPVAIKKDNIVPKALNFAELSVLALPASMVFVIKGFLETPGKARLNITTAAGKLVKSIPVAIGPMGTYSIEWNRADSQNKRVQEGFYLATLSLDNRTILKQFTLYK